MIVDGALVRNNGSITVFSEIIKNYGWEAAQFAKIVSVGTGVDCNSWMKYDSDIGKLDIAVQISDICMDGCAQVCH